MRIERIAAFEPGVSSLSGLPINSADSAEGTDRTARTTDPSAIENSRENEEFAAIKLTVPETNQEAVVVDIDFTAVNQARDQAARLEALSQPELKGVQEEFDLARSADFLAASAAGVLSIDGGNAETETELDLDRLAVLDNTANISRAGSETAATRPDTVIEKAELKTESPLEKPIEPVLALREKQTDEADPDAVDSESSQEAREEQAEQTAEAREVQELKARDREVRSHEQAHKSVLGQHAAGGIQLQFTRGPNGAQYAVSGSVPVDTSEEEQPEDTLQKAQTIRRAALAPAEPSSADRQVAAQASQLEQKARSELQREESEGGGDGVAGAARQITTQYSAGQYNVEDSGSLLQAVA